MNIPTLTGQVSRRRLAIASIAVLALTAGCGELTATTTVSNDAEIAGTEGEVKLNSAGTEELNSEFESSSADSLEEFIQSRWDRRTELRSTQTLAYTGTVTNVERNGDTTTISFTVENIPAEASSDGTNYTYQVDADSLLDKSSGIDTVRYTVKMPTQIVNASGSPTVDGNTATYTKSSIEGDTIRVKSGSTTSSAPGFTAVTGLIAVLVSIGAAVGVKKSNK